MPVSRAALAVAGAILIAGVARAGNSPVPWGYSVWAYGYALPDSKDFINTNVSADHGRLHLEARYNYEAIDTGSVWAGANFSTGGRWEFLAIFMLGGVFGDIEGVAPGYRLSLKHDWFEAASEGEYVIDSHDHSGDFLYSWTEVSGRPVSWCRLGLVAQRTRAYETGLDVQRGFLAGFSAKKVDVSAYVLNVGWKEPTYVLAVAFSF